MTGKKEADAELAKFYQDVLPGDLQRGAAASSIRTSISWRARPICRLAATGSHPEKDDYWVICARSR